MHLMYAKSALELGVPKTFRSCVATIKFLQLYHQMSMPSVRRVQSHLSHVTDEKDTLKYDLGRYDLGRYDLGRYDLGKIVVIKVFVIAACWVTDKRLGSRL